MFKKGTNRVAECSRNELLHSLLHYNTGDCDESCSSVAEIFRARKIWCDIILSLRYALA